VARGSKVNINRAAIDRITVAVADGLLEVGRTVIETAHVPDEPPYGVGLVQRGGAIAYAKGKKVGDSSAMTGGGAIKKPRGVAVNDKDVVVVVGYGFPARFLEVGTVHARPEPFLTPARDEVAGSAAEIAAPIIKAALG
jgi:HK97 gp10 family phage protein